MTYRNIVTVSNSQYSGGRGVNLSAEAMEGM